MSALAFLFPSWARLLFLSLARHGREWDVLFAPARGMFLFAGMLLFATFALPPGRPHTRRLPSSFASC